MPQKTRTRTPTAAILATLVLTSTLWLQASAAVAQCNGYSVAHTPAFGVPQELWGELRPADLEQLPPERDTTDFNHFGNWLFYPYFMSLDVENGLLFTAASQRLMIWDTRQTPETPELVSDLGLDAMDLTWSFDVRVSFLFSDVDAPNGRDDLVALAGRNGVGIAVFDTSSPSEPHLMYQDHGTGTILERTGNQIYSTVLEDAGGQERAYAFLAASGTAGGLFSYDLDAARDLYENSAESCIEGQPAESTTCPGVFLGRVGDRQHVNAIDGSGNYLVAASIGDHGGSTSGSLEMWDVSDPTAPELVLDALPNDPVFDIAMWQQGASYFLAVRTLDEHRIYDVTCVTQGPCSLGAPMWSQGASIPTAPNLGTVTASVSGETPFLYWGTGNFCPSFPQEEWLYDVSNPAAPRDISPQAQVDIDGQSTTYWSWYYRTGGSLGFNDVKPVAGIFNGPYFYRAAQGILDVHKWTVSEPPIGAFTVSPQPAYAGREVTFTDMSVGLPFSWSWTFGPDATPAASTDQHPSTTFASPGLKTVTLEVTNDAGSDIEEMTLMVLDPGPQSADISFQPESPRLCQTLELQAQDIVGATPLTVEWQIFDPNGQPVATSDANPFAWRIPSSLDAGTYSVDLTVSNEFGAATQSVQVEVREPTQARIPVTCEALDNGGSAARRSVN